MKTRKLKSLPAFSTEDAERSFWATHDSAEYVDWEGAQRRSLPNLKPTLRTISIRLPESMIGHLKVLANKRDMPYQSLLKQLLAEQLKMELVSPRGRLDSPSMIREPSAAYGKLLRGRVGKPRRRG